VVTAEFSSTLCSGEALIINGNTYDEHNPTGVELFPKSSVLGCDSTLNIELLFYPEAVSIINPVLCPGESISINGTVYDENYPSGKTVLPDSSYLGCDSLVQINLSFYPEAIEIISDTLPAGESFIVQGQPITRTILMVQRSLPNGSITGCGFYNSG
jgi:hypothetical protein